MWGQCLSVSHLKSLLSSFAGSLWLGFSFHCGFSRTCCKALLSKCFVLVSVTFVTLKNNEVIKQRDGSYSSKQNELKSRSPADWACSQIATENLTFGQIQQPLMRKISSTSIMKGCYIWVSAQGEHRKTHTCMSTVNSCQTNSESLNSPQPVWALQVNDYASSLLSAEACHALDGCLLFASEWWRKIKTGVFSFDVIERAGNRNLAAPSFWYWCLYSARLMNLPELCNSGSEWDRSSPAM